MNKPMYEPPKSKKVVNNISSNIDTRLKIAKTAPPIDIQFFIDDGSFICKFLQFINAHFNCSKIAKNDDKSNIHRQFR